MQSMRLSKLNVLAPGLILVLLIQAAGAQQIRYVYDDLGRLIAVIDQQGRTAM
jgi:YD repeat-containing protein